MNVLPDYVEHLLEFRYQPNPKVLDHRGNWVDILRDSLNMSEFGITQDRLDVFDEDHKRRGFVGFKNAGYVTRDDETNNYFVDNSKKFLRNIFKFEDFGPILSVSRIGVRLKTFTGSDSDFEKLKDLYLERIVKLSPKSTEILDAEVTDIGVPLICKDNVGEFKINFGPMGSKQASQFLNRKVTSHDVGIYFDIDYYINYPTNVDMSFHDFSKNLVNLSVKGWEKYNNFMKLLLKI
jgi:hypothetical protein